MRAIVFSTAFFLLALSFSCTSVQQDKAAPSKSVLITVDIVDKEISYLIGQDKLDASNIYYELSRIYGDDASNTKVLILMHDNVPLNRMRWLSSIIGKIGAKEIRYFYFGDSKRMMGEIDFKRSVMFTDDPNKIK